MLRIYLRRCGHLEIDPHVDWEAMHHRIFQYSGEWFHKLITIVFIISAHQLPPKTRSGHHVNGRYGHGSYMRNH